MFPIDKVPRNGPSTKDIDVKRMMSFFQSVLDKPEMKKKDSLVLLNVGMHLARTSRLQSAFSIIDAYISQAKQHNNNIIWRGQNAIWVNARYNPPFQRQFITNPVRGTSKFYMNRFPSIYC